MNQDVYRFLFNTIDLTTLNSTDSNQSVAAFVERVNAFDEEYPQLKNVAAICVYPNFAEIVRTVPMCPMWTSHACRGIPFVPDIRGGEACRDSAGRGRRLPMK